MNWASGGFPDAFDARWLDIVRSIAAEERDIALSDGSDFKKIGGCGEPRTDDSATGSPRERVAS